MPLQALPIAAFVAGGSVLAVGVFAGIQALSAFGTVLVGGSFLTALLR